MPLAQNHVRLKGPRVERRPFRGRLWGRNSPCPPTRSGHGGGRGRQGPLWAASLVGASQRAHDAARFPEPDKKGLVRKGKSFFIFHRWGWGRSATASVSQRGKGRRFQAGTPMALSSRSQTRCCFMASRKSFMVFSVLSSVTRPASSASSGRPDACKSCRAWRGRAMALRCR